MFPARGPARVSNAMPLATRMQLKRTQKMQHIMKWATDNSSRFRTKLSNCRCRRPAARLSWGAMNAMGARDLARRRLGARGRVAAPATLRAFVAAFVHVRVAFVIFRHVDSVRLCGRIA